MLDMQTAKALLVVDVQNDFTPGGALAVSGGDEIIPIINQYIEYFLNHNWPVFASRDWHPPETKHFEKYGGTWPVHCVADSKGAMFHPQLKISRDVKVISKGMNPGDDGYSAFEAVTPRFESLSRLLKKAKVEDLYICGLATDYCVKASVLDALKEGLTVYLLMDAIRGVDLKPKDSQMAVAQMVSKGAKKLTFSDLPA